MFMIQWGLNVKKTVPQNTAECEESWREGSRERPPPRRHAGDKQRSRASKAEGQFLHWPHFHNNRELNKGAHRIYYECEFLKLQP